MRAPPLLVALTGLLLAASAAAEPLIYEGQLDGLPPDADTVDLRFALFADPAAGDPVWVSDDLTLDVIEGRFVAELERGPDGMLEPYHFAGSRWLEVTVLPPGAEAVTLAPRQRIGRVPFSFDGMTLHGPNGVYDITVDCPDNPQDRPQAGAFASIHDALAWLADKRIASTSRVRISVVSGRCYDQPPLRVTHPDGRRIHIVGDAGENANGEVIRPTIEFASGGLSVVDGAELGLVRGLIFSGPGIDGGTHGVLVGANARLDFDDIEVENFLICLYATDGGIALDRGGIGPLRVSGCRDGVLANNNALIYANDIEATENTEGGIRATVNSTVSTASAVSAGNGQYGFRATHGSVMELYYPTARENGFQGFLSQQNSHMVASYAWSHDNVGGGFQASLGGTIDAGSSTAERNASGYRASSMGAISAGRSYSVDNANHQVHAQTQAYVDFDCADRTARAEELNPDGPPPPSKLAGPEPLHTESEGVIYAFECDGVPAERVYGRALRDFVGRVDFPGHIVTRNASPPCCGVP